MTYMRAFILGLLGGLCATLLPRLTVQLHADDVVVLPRAFIQIAVGIFVLVAGVVAAIEGGQTDRAPKDIFFTALGLPALAASIWTTNTAATQVSDLHRTNVGLARELEHTADIPRETGMNPSAFDIQAPQFYVVVASSISCDTIGEEARAIPGVRTLLRGGLCYAAIGPMSEGEAVLRARELQKQGLHPRLLPLDPTKESTA